MDKMELINYLEKRKEELIRDRIKLAETCIKKRREVAIRQTQGRICELNYIIKILKKQTEKTI